jgi:hypothetical protein
MRKQGKRLLIIRESRLVVYKMVLIISRVLFLIRSANKINSHGNARIRVLQ